MNYPSHWPRPNPTRPKAVATRVTEQDKVDLHERKITTRDLAKRLGVKEAYLSHLFPGKVETPVRAKRVLLGVRKQFRLQQAQRVLNGELETKAAAIVSRVSYRVMARVVQTLRESVKAAGTTNGN